MNTQYTQWPVENGKSKYGHQAQKILTLMQAGSVICIVYHGHNMTEQRDFCIT